MTDPTTPHPLVGKYLVLIEGDWNSAHVIRADLGDHMFLIEHLHTRSYQPLGWKRVVALGQLAFMGDEAMIFDDLAGVREWRGDEKKPKVVRLVKGGAKPKGKDA
jgi:hypothetical protein